MSTYMVPRDFSLPPETFIPPDEDDDGDDDDAIYARDCKTLDTDSLMLLVAERFSDSDALRAWVEETKRKPYLPGERRTVGISDSLRLTNALAAILADVMDEQVEMIDVGGA
jgi:hypothetical protein